MEIIIWLMRDGDLSGSNVYQPVLGRLHRITDILDMIVQRPQSSAGKLVFMDSCDNRKPQKTAVLKFLKFSENKSEKEDMHRVEF